MSRKRSKGKMADDIEQVSKGGTLGEPAGNVGRKQAGQPRVNSSRMARPSTRGGSGNYEAVVGKSYFLDNIQLTQQPQGHTTLYDGSTLSTMYGSNVFRLNHQDIIMQVEYPQVHWDTFLSTNAASTSVTANNLSVFVQSLFQDMVGVMNFKGRFTPNQILSAVGDWAKWLNTYTQVFTAVRTMQAIISSMGLNGWFKQFMSAFATNGNFDRVELLAQRLQKIPLPKRFVEYLDMLCGVYTITDDDLVIIAYINTNATNAAITNLTSATDVSTLLGNMEALMPSVEGTTTFEGNIINQVLAMTYGAPSPFPAKSFHTDPTLFDLHYMAAAGLRDTTANLTYAAPLTTGVSGTPGTIPLPIRYGANAPWLMTLLRPAPYLEGGTGVANASYVGLMSYPSDDGSFMRVYAADNSSTAISNNRTAAIGTAFNPTTSSYVQWWPELASIGAAGIWQNDSRRYAQWDEYYVGTDRLGVASLKLLETLFLTGI